MTACRRSPPRCDQKQPAGQIVAMLAEVPQNNRRPPATRDIKDAEDAAPSASPTRQPGRSHRDFNVVAGGRAPDLVQWLVAAVPLRTAWSRADWRDASTIAKVPAAQQLPTALRRLPGHLQRVPGQTALEIIGNDQTAQSRHLAVQRASNHCRRTHWRSKEDSGQSRAALVPQSSIAIDPLARPSSRTNGERPHPPCESGALADVSRVLPTLTGRNCAVYSMLARPAPERSGHYRASHRQPRRPSVEVVALALDSIDELLAASAALYVLRQRAMTTASGTVRTAEECPRRCWNTSSTSTATPPARWSAALRCEQPTPPSTPLSGKARRRRRWWTRCDRHRSLSPGRTKPNDRKPVSRFLPSTRDPVWGQRLQCCDVVIPKVDCDCVGWRNHPADSSDAARVLFFYL